jgi:hypothetical protein
MTIFVIDAGHPAQGLFEFSENNIPYAMKESKIRESHCSAAKKEK